MNMKLKGVITPDRVNSIRVLLGLTHKQLGKLLGVEEDTAYRYCTMARLIPAEGLRILEETYKKAPEWTAANTIQLMGLIDLHKIYEPEALEKLLGNGDITMKQLSLVWSGSTLPPYFVRQQALDFIDYCNSLPELNIPELVYSSGGIQQFADQNNVSTHTVHKWLYGVSHPYRDPRVAGILGLPICLKPRGVNAIKEQ